MGHHVDSELFKLNINSKVHHIRYIQGVLGFYSSNSTKFSLPKIKSILLYKLFQKVFCSTLHFLDESFFQYILYSNNNKLGFSLDIEVLLGVKKSLHKYSFATIIVNKLKICMKITFINIFIKACNNSYLIL